MSTCIPFLCKTKHIYRSSRSEVFLRKENMQQIYGRKRMPKCDFNKVSSNFIKIALRHGCSPVNLLHIFRAPFPRNTSGWLLLYLVNMILSFGCHIIFFVATAYFFVIYMTLVVTQLLCEVFFCWHNIVFCATHNSFLCNMDRMWA